MKIEGEINLVERGLKSKDGNKTFGAIELADARKILVFGAFPEGVEQGVAISADCYQKEAGLFYLNYKDGRSQKVPNLKIIGQGRIEAPISPKKQKKLVEIPKGWEGEILIKIQ